MAPFNTATHSDRGVGRWREHGTEVTSRFPLAPAMPFARGGHPLLMVAWVLVIAAGLWLVPGRSQILPLVESDYAYMLTAADRLYEGYGLTAPVPVAPHQPWMWQSDWRFLTKWPAGYPVSICVGRWLLGISSLQACQIISVLACALALVGWFCLARSLLPAGITSLICAALLAGSSVGAASLVHPSTDILLTAAIPFVLMMANRMALAEPDTDRTRSRYRALSLPAMVGLAAGSLFWIRYASVFVPLAIGCFCVLQWLRRAMPLGSIVVFCLAAVLPIGLQLAANRLWGSGESLQSQLNLGQRMILDLSPALFVQAWYHFTDLGFYDYHAFTKHVFAFWPLAVILATWLTPFGRGIWRPYFTSPSIMLAIIVSGVLLLMLVTVTAVFGDKYPYVTLPRYYLGIKPLYFILFVGPILMVRVRAIRASTAVVLLVGCSWVAGQQWQRPYESDRIAQTERTPYGTRAQAFTPHSVTLYEWLKKQQSEDLIVVSNFHEFITLETMIPTLPIPPDWPTFEDWIARIVATRGISHPRVLFVLDPDNRWRDYWIAAPKEVIRMFDLNRSLTHPPIDATYVWQVGQSS